MMVICQTNKFVLWEIPASGVVPILHANNTRWDTVHTEKNRWDIYKIDEKGFWHWIDENNPKHYYSLEEAKIGFLLESI